jgi:hypothetical protein
MADIEEIPVGLESAAAPPEPVEPPPKRGRGRPPGAKNKPKPPPKEPKAKLKATKKPIPVEYEEESSEEEVAPRGAAAEPLDRRALAAEMLGLLQQQRYSRASARRDHYAKWFENM